MSYQLIGVRGFEDVKLRLGQIPPGKDAFLINLDRCSHHGFAAQMNRVEAIIADYDGTLTPLRDENGLPTNQWVRLKEHMIPKLRDDDQEQANAYFRPGSPRTPEGDAELVLDTVARFAESDLMLHDLWRTARATRHRAGADTLLGLFPGKTGIVSYGIYPFIRYWAESASLEGIDIAATRFTWREVEEGVFQMTGCDPFTIITDDNKGPAFSQLCAKYRTDPKRVLVVGDSPGDNGMLQRGFGIGLWEPEAEESDLRGSRIEQLSRVWPNVHAVLVSHSLRPLVAMIRS